MAILRAMDGKFYDVPDDQAAKFEVPREKVKELLEKSGVPAQQQGGPGPGPGGQRGGPPPGGAGAGNPVIVHIHAAGTPHVQSGPPGGQPAQAGGPQQGGDAEVDPYWWIWRNYWPNWGNFWPNY